MIWQGFELGTYHYATKPFENIGELENHSRPQQNLYA